MKLGVMSALFSGRKLEDVVAFCAQAGLGAIELPVGAYPGKPFFDPAQVLDDPKAQERIRSLLRDHKLELSAISVHGNPVHPDAAIARTHHDEFVVAVKLARALGTDTVITFSGCPGGGPTDTAPNWVTCPWPPEYTKTLEWQWNDVLVPYWAEQAKRCAAAGVRTAWEAHPGFCVYNTDTLIRLAERAQQSAGVSGKVLGANLDPSHFFWQGIDPILATRELGEAGLIFHVHAKDTELDRHEGPLHGYNDARPYTDLKQRAWSFRTCGYGHGHEFWKPFVSMLRRYGYDHVLSIEHEDALMSVEEGFRKAVSFLREAVISEPAAKPWWT